MNQSLRKTKLASAIALSITSYNANAFDIAVTNMVFGTTYAASGTLLGSGGGTLNSVDPFYGSPWTAAQQTVFMDDTGTWSGTSGQGAFDFNNPIDYIGSMTADQRAVGMFFDWNTNIGIAVLEIFDCAVRTAVGPAGDPVCSGNGVPMANGPFVGSTAIFNGTGSDFDPVANDDSASTTPGVFVDIDIVGNDTDKDEVGGDLSSATFTIQLPANSTQGGTLVDQGSGVVRYTPSGGLIADDSDDFTYTVTDALPTSNVSNIATVSISILADANSPPTSKNVIIITDEDTPIDIAVTDVAEDAEGDLMTFSTFDAATTQGGTITSNQANDILTYTPKAEFSGADMFNFQAFDGIEASAVITQNITVNEVNDAPVCDGASLATGVNETLVVTGDELVAGCTDAEGDTVTYVTLSATQPGNASLSDDGATPTATLTIVPNTDFSGDDAFEYEVTDGNSNTIVPASLKIGTVFSNFTMLDNVTQDGKVFGGTNDILFEWDGEFNTDASDATVGHMTIETAKPQPFFSFFWEATRIRVYEGPADGEPPRHLEFDTACSTAQYEAGTTECGGLKIVMDIPAGHIAGHILFHWGQPDAGSPCGVQNCDIDVVNVWQPDGVWDRHGKTGLFNALWDGAAGVAPDPEGTWEFVTIDSNGDGINGQPMIDGPFQGLYPTYNIAPSGEGEAKPPFVNTQQDTKLDDNVFSMNIAGLLASLMMLLGLRHIGRKK